MPKLIFKIPNVIIQMLACNILEEEKEKFYVTILHSDSEIDGNA